MSESLTPTETLVTVTKLKYRSAALPFLIIMLAFVTGFFIELRLLNYVSFAGFALFLYTLFRYRVNMYVQSDPENFILAPVNGVIVQVSSDEGTSRIIIKKRLTDKADIRFATDGEVLERTKANLLTAHNQSLNTKWTLEGGNLSVMKFSDNRPKGLLIGLTPSSSICTVHFPSNLTPEVEEGDKVLAGETRLGELS
jgi:hypothetical protein